MNRLKVNSAALLASIERHERFRTLGLQLLAGSLKVHSTYVITEVPAEVVSRVTTPATPVDSNGRQCQRASFGPVNYAYVLCSRLREVLSGLAEQEVTIDLNNDGLSRLCAVDETQQLVEFELWKLASQPGNPLPKAFNGW